MFRGGYSSWFRGQDLVGVVSAKGLNASFDVDSSTIRGVSTGQLHDTLHCLPCVLVGLFVLLDLLCVCVRISDVYVLWRQGLRESFGVLKCRVEFVGLDEMVPCADVG